MRPSRAVLSLVLVTALTAVVLAMVFMSLGYTKSARTVPLVVGVPTAVFLVIQWGRDVAAMVKGDRVGGTANAQEADRHEGRSGHDALEDRAEDGAGLAVTAPEQATATALAATLWVVALALLIWVVGMMVAIPVFTIGFMRVFGGERWRTCIAFAVGTSVAVYAFFILLLEIRLYQGLFGDLVPFL